MTPTKFLAVAAAMVMTVTALGQDREDASGFVPIVEAPLPEGFPDPAPVGRIVIKRYPKYRLATTSMDNAGNAAFWRLFLHIKKEQIAMTAPVEITYDKGTDLQMSKRSMAFLYPRADLGVPTKETSVEVIDVGPMTTVSLGLTGNLTEPRLRAAERRLRTWLSNQAEKYEVVGPLRVMAYNSPFVPAASRYHEVELPVRRAD